MTTSYFNFTTSFFFLIYLLLSDDVQSDNVYDWEPSVSLTANFDEPLGFCIDISGFGAGIDCDSLQAHSCKSSGADTQFEYHSSTKSLRAVNYNSDCDSITSANDRACVGVKGDLIDGDELGLVKCNPWKKQRFEAIKKGNGSYELRVGGTSSDLCLAVSDTTRNAGPFLARDLYIAKCSSTANELMTWTISPTPPPTGPCTDSGSQCCKNDRTFRYQKKKQKSCKWISGKENRRNNLCTKKSIQIACPMSCGFCCANDKTFSFTAVDGKKRKCAYVGKNPKRIKKYCVNANIKSNCPIACNNCFETV